MHSLLQAQSTRLGFTLLDLPVKLVEYAIGAVTGAIIGDSVEGHERGFRKSPAFGEFFALDSLSLVTLNVALEERYDITLPDFISDEARTVRSVRDVARTWLDETGTVALERL